jgi:hypothetical protein
VVPVELVESLQEQVGYLRGALEIRDKELAARCAVYLNALHRTRMVLEAVLCELTPMLLTDGLYHRSRGHGPGMGLPL